MLYKFPKFVIGILTRDSVRQALKNGIKAAQIIKFLEMHSHPEMLKENSKLPPTVVDQIILWEKERDRFLFKNGTLYSQFNSQPEFEVLRNHASVSQLFFIHVIFLVNSNVLFIYLFFILS